MLDWKNKVVNDTKVSSFALVCLCKFYALKTVSVVERYPEGDFFVMHYKYNSFFFFVFFLDSYHSNVMRCSMVSYRSLSP